MNVQKRKELNLYNDEAISIPRIQQMRTYMQK